MVRQTVVGERQRERFAREKKTKTRGVPTMKKRGTKIPRSLASDAARRRRRGTLSNARGAAEPRDDETRRRASGRPRDADRKDAKARTSSIHCGDTSSPSSKSSGVTFGWKSAYASPSNLNSCPPVGLFGASAPAPEAGGGASGSETFWPIGVGRRRGAGGECRASALFAHKSSRHTGDFHLGPPREVREPQRASRRHVF